MRWALGAVSIFLFLWGIIALTSIKPDIVQMTVPVLLD
jgi:hypothetical protein